MHPSFSRHLKIMMETSIAITHSNKMCDNNTSWYPHNTHWASQRMLQLNTSISHESLSLSHCQIHKHNWTENWTNSFAKVRIHIILYHMLGSHVNLTFRQNIDKMITFFKKKHFNRSKPTMFVITNFGGERLIKYSFTVNIIPLQSCLVLPYSCLN